MADAKPNRTNKTKATDASHPSHTSPPSHPEGFIPPHGGYEKLLSFQKALAIYDATVRFCDRFIDRKSRTHDQMVQAARSGNKNTAEGSQMSVTSKESELKLVNVSRGSLEELLGPIPHGWTADTIKNRSSNIQYGFTQSATKEPVGPHFLRITDISGGRIDWASVPFCQATDEEREKYRIVDGDIFIARTGASTGDNIYAVEPPPAVFASYLIRIQFSSRGLGRLVGEFTRTPDYASYVAGTIGGSAQPNASAQTLAGASMVFPTEEIADAFYRTVRPLDLMGAANDRESRTLATLRDTLLPNVIDRSRMTRAERAAVPFELVREAVINALVHRDYDLTGATCHLVVTADTVTVRSPGAPFLPITVEQMQDFTAPMYNRNPKLQFAFGGTKLVEGRGFGMRTFGEAAAKHGLPMPKYAFDGLYLNLTIYRDAGAAVSGLKADVLKALNDDERKSWEYLATKTSVTRKEYAEHLGFDARKAQRHLKRFVKLELLRKVGASSSTEYEVRKP